MKGEQTAEERMNNLQSVTKFFEHIITLNREQHNISPQKQELEATKKIHAIGILGGSLPTVVTPAVLSSSEVKSWWR